MSRRSSTARLAGWLGLLAVLAAALSVTAYALTRSSGPTPPKRSLAGAIHAGLAGKPVAGLSADFTVTQHLLPGSSSLVSQMPISGATGHVWAANGHVRLQVRTRLGRVDVGFDGSRVTLWDHKTNVAYVLPVPAAKADGTSRAKHAPPTIADIRKLLGRIGGQAVVSGAEPGTVAGRPAYTVRVSPRHDAGLLGAAELAWDAQHGVPLRLAIFPRGSDTAAIEIAVTHIRYGTVPAGAMAVTPATGTKIVHVHLPKRSELRASAHHAASTAATGPAAVQRAVGFRLAAPASLAGMPRTGVRSIQLGKAPAALVTYGHGLAAIAVIERKGDAKHGSLGALPAATIAGIRARELDTTLGTLVQVSRAGVTYTVMGFQPASMITSAAGSLL